VGSLDNAVSGGFSSQYFSLMIPLLVGSVAAAVIELALQRVDEHQQCHEKKHGQVRFDALVFAALVSW